MLISAFGSDWKSSHNRLSSTAPFRLVLGNWPSRGVVHRWTLWYIQQSPFSLCSNGVLHVLADEIRRRKVRDTALAHLHNFGQDGLYVNRRQKIKCKITKSSDVLLDALQVQALIGQTSPWLHSLTMFSISWCSFLRTYNIIVIDPPQTLLKSAQAMIDFFKHGPWLDYDDHRFNKLKAKTRSKVAFT